jgi:hypothetical protein
MAASWTLEPAFVLDTGVADGIATSPFQSLLPGESSLVEVLRADLLPLTESWRIRIVASVDGLLGSDVSTINRVYGPLFLRPMFVVDSLGTPFYAITIQNAEAGPADIVRAVVRINRDGVNLP